MGNQRTQTEKKNAPGKPPAPTHRPALEGEKKEGEEGQKAKWDIIDENAWESFPASDPPASWAGRDIPPEEREKARQQQQEKKKN